MEIMKKIGHFSFFLLHRKLVILVLFIILLLNVSWATELTEEEYLRSFNRRRPGRRIFRQPSFPPDPSRNTVRQIYFRLRRDGVIAVPVVVPDINQNNNPPDVIVNVRPEPGNDINPSYYDRLIQYCSNSRYLTRLYNFSGSFLKLFVFINHVWIHTIIYLYFNQIIFHPDGIFSLDKLVAIVVSTFFLIVFSKSITGGRNERNRSDGYLSVGRLRDASVRLVEEEDNDDSDSIASEESTCIANALKFYNNYISVVDQFSMLLFFGYIPIFFLNFFYPNEFLNNNSVFFCILLTLFSFMSLMNDRIHLILPHLLVPLNWYMFFILLKDESYFSNIIMTSGMVGALIGLFSFMYR